MINKANVRNYFPTIPKYKKTGQQMSLNSIITYGGSYTSYHIYIFYSLFKYLICCYSGNTNRYIICKNFNYMTITVHEIQRGVRQTDGQQSLSNRVPLPFEYVTFKMSYYVIEKFIIYLTSHNVTI